MEGLVLCASTNLQEKETANRYVITFTLFKRLSSVVNYTLGLTLEFLGLSRGQIMITQSVAIFSQQK